MPDCRLPATVTVCALPAVVVRDGATAAAVLRLAAPRGALLLSPPGAAESLGAAWFLAVVAAAVDAVPGVPHAAALDCGAAPGHALAALRLGVRIVVLDGAVPAFAAVAAAAAESGAVVWAVAPPAFDPARQGLMAPRARAQLTGWLATR